MNPKYTDQQMALILKRATELQATGDEPTHSLESIQQIARQVGIDPRTVAEVAAGLDRTGGAPSLFGAPSAYRATLRLPGTAPTIDHALVLATIRDHLPFVGQSKAVGDGIEWYAGPADNKTVVSISPGADGTTVRIDARQHGVKVMAYLGATTVGLVASVVSIGLLHGVGVGVGLAAFAGAFAGARAIWNSQVRLRTKRFHALSDALVEQIEAAKPPVE